MSLYPFLRSPFTDITAFMLNNQQYPNDMCAKLEMRFYDCLEAYGVSGAGKQCKEYLEDLRECSLRLKEVGWVKLIFLIYFSVVGGTVQSDALGTRTSILFG